MTSIRGRGRSRRKHTFKGPSGSLPPPESSHDEAIVYPPAVEPPIAKYTEKDLQRMLRTVLEAQASPFHGICEKPLKARSHYVYCSKSDMECYNFCQQYEDHFATAGGKGPNNILFAAFFLRDCINFRWQQYIWKHEAESTVPITWKEFKTFLCQSLRDSRSFVNSYWSKIKRDSQYQQKNVLDWAAHLENLQVVLREFDSVAAPNKDIMIRYFREGLQPSIEAWLDIWDRELDSWDEVVDKTVDAEAKTSL